MTPLIVPSHLQVEPVNGICTARCSMCAIGSWTRQPRIMSEQDFMAVLGQFMPYRDNLRFLSLQGFGETLCDKGIVKKVDIAHRMGFRGIGFASNCSLLASHLSLDLMMAGLNTLICSVDGARKETHESIRRGLDFDEIVQNVLKFIELRNKYGATKVIIRFIRQKSNEQEWSEFKSWWEARLDPAYGDEVTSFDIVDCDSKVKTFEEQDVSGGKPVPDYCEQLYRRMIVLSNGDVALCCADDNGTASGEYLGNVISQEPMEIYNNETFTHYRQMMAEGRLRELAPCNTCTIPRSVK